jgi:VIT1/CCC1 family predicted Fe2+/Mn2+ transporter
VDAIADEFNYILEPITGENQRQALYQDILDHLRDSQPCQIGLKREDFTGALAGVLVAVIAVLPSLVPFVLLRDNYALAIRVSNVVSFIVLFASGYYWGKYTDAHPWKTGLVLVGIGVLLVAIAIPLGG